MGVQLTQEMILGAQKTQELYGVPASVTLAQIILESGGSYAGGLSLLAHKYNNLFGIKAGSSWTGKTVNMSTGEEVNGSHITIKDNFRWYDSVMDSIIDHGKLLAQPFYTKYTASATNADEYARAIHKAGYATDSSYADTLISIMKRDNLYQYDSGKIGGVTIGGSGGTSGSSGIGGIFGNGINQILVLITVCVLLIIGALFFASAFIGSPVKTVEKTTKKIKKAVK